VLAGRRLRLLESIAQEIASRGGESYALELDVADARSVSAPVATQNASPVVGSKCLT
jgi:NADP-dependent 3-hydroxy acid dehydrogenase YdfG